MTLIELLERVQVALASGVPEDAEFRFGHVDGDLMEFKPDSAVALRTWERDGRSWNLVWTRSDVAR